MSIIKNIIGYCLTFVVCSFLVLVFFASWDNEGCKSYSELVVENKRDQRARGIIAMKSNKRTHRVIKGQTYIAKKYKTSVKALKQIKGRNETIYINQIIRVE